jgi:hypothetical protein
MMQRRRGVAESEEHQKASVFTEGRAPCGVFWPLAHEAGAKLVEVSDRRLVWLDLRIP